MSKYTAVVAVGNPENVVSLMSTGCMMANEHDGRVIAVTVVQVDCEAVVGTRDSHDRMTSAHAVLYAAEAVAERWECEYECRLAVGRRVQKVLNEVAEAEQADVIIVGFSERQHPRGVDVRFERLVDEIAAHAQCDLVVARFRGSDRYDRVMVPVRSVVNLNVRRTLVTAMHNQLGAQVDVLHFASSERERAEMRERLSDWLVERGVSDWTSLRVEVNDDPAEGILEASRDYDAVVMRTAPLHEVRRKYFGAIAEHIANHATCSTFLVRTGSVKPEI